MAVVGYARVSTEDQNLDLQLDALSRAGCEHIFKDDGISAIAERRPGFEAALASLQRGDSFVIWKMDRAFRSCKNALDTLEVLERRGVSFLSITEVIDTQTPMGRCMYQIRNAFAELERTLISERTKAGLAAARRRGKTLGRRRKLTPEQVESVRKEMVQDSQVNLRERALKLNVSLRTLLRALRQPATDKSDRQELAA